MRQCRRTIECRSGSRSRTITRLLGAVDLLDRAVVADQEDPVMSLSVLGGPWRDVRVVEISDQRAVVDMCQCTGELVEQRGSNDPIVLEYLRKHPQADA